MKNYKPSEFVAMPLIDRVRAFIEASRMDVEVEVIDKGILSDIGTEGLVFDKYVVYLAKGEYEFKTITGKRTLPGYHVWKEIDIPSTLWVPADSDIVEILTTQREDEAIVKCLEVVLNYRLNNFLDVLAASEAAEAEEEYQRLLKENPID